MSGPTYKGLPTPKGLSRELQQWMATVDEVIQRGIPNVDISLTGFTSTGGAGGAGVRLATVTGSGRIATIQAGRRIGEVVVLRFVGGGSADSTGNMQLAGVFQSRTPRDTLSLIWNGSTWIEMARGPAGYERWIAAEAFGAIPDTGNDVTAGIQTAFNNTPADTGLWFRPGTFLVTADLSMPTNATVWAPGAVFDATDSTLTTALLTVGSSAAVTHGGLYGLTLTRTASSTASTGRAYIGLQLLGPQAWDFSNLKISNFTTGILATGRT